MALIQNIVNFKLENRTGAIKNNNDEKPWIQIIKNSNQFNTDDTFPQIKLMSRVLYNKNTSTPSVSSTWGFPMFDISKNGKRDSENWSYYNTTTKPSLTRLDLSRNLVVLDYQTLNPLRSELTHSIIQLHSSVEIQDNTITGNYVWYKYIYTGNIINPYKTIDFGPHLAISSNSIASWFNMINTTLDTYTNLTVNLVCEPELIDGTNSGKLITQSLCDLSANDNLNTFGNNYDINNLLWYSLRSPTDISSSTLAFNVKKRFISNFNKTNGGGYKRYSQTIDIPRKTRKPYGIISDISFAPQNGEGYVTGISDLNYYEVEFKPLINPISQLSLTYQFGKNHGSKVTFFRESGMDGIPNPSGTSISNANRLSESITLTWDANDQSKKKIKLLDIASGFHKIEPTFTTSDSFFNDISTTYLSNYDISCNVFQFRLLDLNQNSNYKVLNQFGESETFDLSYIPINYEHFRYKENFVDGTNKNPFSLEDEQITFNLNKIKKIDSTFSELVFPKSQINFPSITPGQLTVNKTNKITIRPNKDSTETDKRLVLDATNINPFSSVNVDCKTLQINNNFISDYWQYNNKISDLSDNTVALGAKEINYGDFIAQTKLAALVILVGVKMNKIKVLLNTSNESYTELLATSDTRLLHVLSENGTSIARELPEFQIIGGDVTTPKITEIPLLVSTIANSFPSPPYSHHSDHYPKNIFPNDNISIGSSDGKFTYNIVEAFKNQRNDDPIVGDLYYNGLYSVDFRTSNNSNNTLHNENFIDISVNPTNMELNLVELTPGDENGYFLDSNGETTFHPFLFLANNNNSITLTWCGLNYASTQGNVYWTISRFNTQDEVTKSVTQIVPSTVGGTVKSIDGKNSITTTSRCYTYIDTDIRIYDKYIYTITGEFRWYPYNDSRVLTLNVPIGGNGSLFFKFNEMIICKFNRFPFGRWNTTTTNLKLYRPLLLNTEKGQVDQFGKQRGSCGANGLFSINRQISSSNNIYSNTANQTSKKLTYSRLAKNINRPYR